MSTRDIIATAASTVDGVLCEPYFGGNTDPGGAFVKLDSTQYPNKFGGVDRWKVVLVLPQDLTTAERFADERIPALVTALLPELQITESTGVQRFDIPGVGIFLTASITGLRETE